MKKIVLISLIMSLKILTTYGQEQSYDELMDMSIEELMQVEVFSVSKKKESLFEAALSSSVVTKEQIINAGITSIPEALRLIPGVIVREASNGNYDVHLRGMDNLARYTDASTSGNQITLVMIDSRPVFNNNTGGIFWENLPVDIVEVERIEVVRGPSSPLYGPNAVSGVINIITSEPDKEGFSADAIANYGTSDFESSAISTAGVQLAYKFNNKFDVSLSANLQNRQRLDNEYFSYLQKEYVPIDSLGVNDPLTGQTFYLSQEDQDMFFPIGQNSMEKYGVNAFINYALQEDISFSFQTGYQDASTQRPLRGNSYTPLSTVEMESTYANLGIEVKGLKGRFSYLNGNDDLNSFPLALPTGDTMRLIYEYENLDAFLEYDWKINDKISVRPGISYLRSTYSDEKLAADPNNFGVLNGPKTIRTYSASLRTDYRITDNLRATLAGRLDYFTAIEDLYGSYQGALSYSLNESNFLRAVVSKSNSGAFMAQTYIDINKSYTISPFPGFSVDGVFRAQGNTDLNLFQLQLFEVGYRSKLLANLELDVELFHQRSMNSNEAVNQEIPAPYFTDASLVQQFQNLPIEARQFGTTISINYRPTNALQFRPYITLQETKSIGFPERLNSPERNVSQNIETTKEVENEQTPSAFGGLTINYKPVEKWNINLTSYYMNAHKQFSSNDVGNRLSTAGEIDPITIINLTANYDVTDYLKIYITGRNLLNSSSREYYAADRKSLVLLGGISLDL